MASPGTTDQKTIHDPKEAKLVTNQNKRVQYLFGKLNWRGGRRAFETWENDGGNVPAEENVYLVNGHLKRGFLAHMQWKMEHWKKQLKAYFSNHRNPTQA